MGIYTTHTGEKQPTEMLQRKLADKYLKSAIINTFKELKKTMSKKLKDSIAMMSH